MRSSRSRLRTPKSTLIKRRSGSFELARPRFFDRYWFAIYEPNGRTALQFTLGVYNNMNVVDGGFVVVHGPRQHNLRVSRSLRPRFEAAVGPMRVAAFVSGGKDEQLQADVVGFIGQLLVTLQ